MWVTADVEKPTVLLSEPTVVVETNLLMLGY